MLIFCAWLALFAGTLAEDDPSQFFPVAGEYAASHILISHRGADRAKAEVTRSRKEARALAEELHAKVMANPESFAELARQFSDGPTGKVGGVLGGFNKGDMAPPFEAALRKLAPGELAPKPVKTQFGFHIMRRDSLKVQHFSCRAIIATYQGAVRLRAIPADSKSLTRSPEEARQFLDKVLPRIGQEDFQALAGEVSDLQGTTFMGVFKRGDNAVNDQLIDAIENLAYGETSTVVDLPFGYAILQRAKVRKLSASRIWLAFKGSEKAPPGVTRSRAEAQQLAGELAQQLASDPGRFEELAKAHSNGPFAIRGGKMAQWFAGYQDAAFEAALNQLKPGEITPAPVTTPAGYFLIRAEEAP